MHISGHRRAARPKKMPHHRTRYWTRSTVAGVLTAVLHSAGCGNLPRDPEHTLQRVQTQKHVRVGLVENPPWVIHGSGGPDGAEVRLVRRLAESLGAAPDWYWGGEQQHMEALRHFELDLVIGGLDAATPWAKTVGLTRPYFTERISVAVPPGVPLPDSLKALSVAGSAGEEAAAYLRKKDARPVRVADLTHVSGPAAGPEWQLRKLGMTLTGFHLLEKKHVIAAPPGENGWLKRIQEFLAAHQGEVPTLLQQSEAVQ